MKKYLLILMMVGLFFSCSEAEEKPITQDEFFAEEKSWADYVGVNSSPVGNATLYYGSALEADIIELDLEKNIIGMDRDLADKTDPYSYRRVGFRLASFTEYYDNNSETGYSYNALYYYNVREGVKLEPGSSAGYITTSYKEGANPSVISSISVDMEAILDMPSNEGLVVGDEVLLVDIYKDEAKTDLVETFSYIL